MATYIMKRAKENKSGVFEIPMSARIIGYENVPPSGTYPPNVIPSYHMEILYLYEVTK